VGFLRKWKNRADSRTYYAWRNMRARCYNPKSDSYPHYGGRGIKVCAEWLDDFDHFFEDMGAAPEGMTLERCDNNAGYSPRNCRWATCKEQSNNKRSNRLLEVGGVVRTMTEWAEIRGLATDTVHHRLARMGTERALSPGSLVPSWRHGTRQGYEKYKCKCQECRASNTLRHRLRRARKQEGDSV